MILIRLILSFCKIGLFSIGGGMATLPFLYELSAHTHWFSYQDIANMIAVSESTPGPLGINMSTYAGYVTAGIPGGILASLGLAFPSFVIIIIVSKFLERFKNSKTVQKAFYGLRPASIALIAAAGLNVAKTSLLNTELFSTTHQIGDLFLIKPILLAVFLFIGQKKWKLHPVLWILTAAVIGILFQF